MGSGGCDPRIVASVKLKDRGGDWGGRVDVNYGLKILKKCEVFVYIL